jgi:trimeric autotransporter adhesin
MKTLNLKTSIERSPLRLGFLVIPLMLACFALAPAAREPAGADQLCQAGCDISLENTFLGQDTLINNTTGFQNAATGSFALTNNTTGFNNTATGAEALEANSTGNNNTATGWEALSDNTTGIQNTAIGSFALFNNTTGNGNTAIGLNALLSNNAGVNTATGVNALAGNTTGIGNTANGTFAANFSNGDNNTAIGFQAYTQATAGNNNTTLGFNAGAHLTTGSDNIDIGNLGVASDSGTIRIGTVGTQTKAFIAGIRDAAIGGVEVRVNMNGRLGTVPSSKRFKDVIKPMDKASAVLLALRPVTFHYKPEIDPEGIPQFGLVAEEVEKVNPDLVVHDKEGKPYSVRYDQVNAMLLNEFLKEHRKVEDQGAMIAKQQKQIEALTAGLQKVSAQVELSKPAPRTVLNDQ